MDGVPLGHHITLDLFECQCDLEWLSRISRGQELMDACSKGFNVLGDRKHQFTPHSYSVVILLEESHLSIHTWTQHRFASMDFYTCSGSLPESCVNAALELLKPKRTVRVDIQRGTKNPIVRTESDYHAGS